ncbi:hypothetical protein Tco_1225749 [Tanacetum coccineum]
MEWEEEDAGLRCFSSTPFTTRFKRKISKSTMVGLRKKVKTGVIHGEGVERKTKKGTHKGKEKVFEDEDVGAVKTGRDRGVVIREGGFNNVGGKEEVVSKRGVRSRKMHRSIVKVESE